MYIYYIYIYHILIYFYICLYRDAKAPPRRPLEAVSGLRKLDKARQLEKVREGSIKLEKTLGDSRKLKTIREHSGKQTRSTRENSRSLDIC